MAAPEADADAYFEAELSPRPFEIEDICIICNLQFSDSASDKVTLTQKGCDTINRLSEQLRDTVCANEGDFVHKKCRCAYINQKVVDAKLREATDPSSPRKRRIPRSGHDETASKCLFCGQGDKFQKKGTLKSSAGKLIPVRTMQFQQTVLQHCDTRNDSWGRKVRAAIEFVQDCVACDMVYHNVCYTNFRSHLQIPKMFIDDEPETKKTCPGRPEDGVRLKAFNLTVQYLDSLDSDQVTVRDLVQYMDDLLQDKECESYTAKYMKKKLLQHYGDEIVFVQSNKKADIISLKNTADSILRKFYKERRETSAEAEKMRLIKAAATIIHNDIRSMTCSKDDYPSTECIENHTSFLPETLCQFLKHVTKRKEESLKLSAIGQSIVQCTRPNTIIAPLQIGLAVQMHRAFGSRFLIDTLNHLGFSSSYKEVKKFQMNAAKSHGVDLPPAADNTIIQFVADNVDHNTATLDGRNTFHGMGMIAAVTPEIRKPSRIPRKDVSIQEIQALGQIDIHFDRSDGRGLSTLTFKQLDICAEDKTANLDLLWKLSWPLKTPRPSWNGMMQMVQQGDHPGKSAFFFLPMIDISASDMSCIFSTLIFICDLAAKSKVTPIVTFDQPLYLKALSITTSENASSNLRNIVLRLGTFHLQMSFLGSIGHLMAGSGLQEMLELVYAPNAVVHMLSGKAYARAIRGHLLVDAALNALLIADAFEAPQLLIKQDGGMECSTYEDGTDIITSLAEALELPLEAEAIETKVDPDLGDGSLNTALEVLEDLMNGDISAKDASEHEIFISILRQLNEKKEKVSGNRTAALWLQYMDMVDILRTSIKAERMGDFKLHLASVQSMLPFLAASGHNNYTKSAWLYLQQMLELQTSHPDVYQFFSKGHHVIRRSDRYWAGLSTDLIIEQVLMRSLKSNGGLTRGTGVGERERLVWLLSMPACAEINATMQFVTDTTFSTSEQHTQHKDVRKSRQERDNRDTTLVLKYLQDRSPFSEDEVLKCISSGRTADADVNVDQAKRVGKNILDNMTGKNGLDVSFKRKDQAVTMALKTSSKASEDIVYVDSTLLFQRLVKVAECTPDILADTFTFELSNVPASLFDSTGLPRKANKAALANYIWSTTEQVDPVLPDQVSFVIDGGSLLHRLTWPRGATYNHILQMYTNFVSLTYKKGTVVFDGYSYGPSTKDVAHLRRTNGGNTGPDIDFTGDMMLTDSKEQFLRNPANKQRFINLLSQELGKTGLSTIHAPGDADRLIVSTALDKATETDTVLIGEDTDLLVLLLQHFTESLHPVYFKSFSMKSKVWDIRNIKNKLSPFVSSGILFAHAVGGCDTTSSLFSIGKSQPLKKLSESASFQKQAAIFMSPNSKREEIIAAGDKALTLLYGGKDGDSLDKLRYVKYMQKVATCTVSLDPSKLPPTSSAAKFHSMRTYFQVQEWLHLANFCLVPHDWGWGIRQQLLFPVMTDIDVAPEALLNVIKCTCKTDCQTARCTCRRHGLVCTVACKQCRGQSCVNTANVADGITVDDDEFSEEEDV